MIVSSFRIISISDNMTTAVNYFKKIFTGFSSSLEAIGSFADLFPGMSSMAVFFFLLGTLILAISDILTEKGRGELLLMKNFPLLLRGAVYCIGIYMIILNISMNSTVGFLYAEY